MKFLSRIAASTKGKGKGKGRRFGWKMSIGLVLAAGGFAVLLVYAAWAQAFDMKKVGEMPERNTVFDVDGKIYSRLAGSNRIIVPLDQVSPYFVDALLAREDTRFFDHGGIDWRGIARALVRNVASGSVREGGSGITQQLARNSLPLGGRSIHRKLLEAMVALRIERTFTKQQILELYLNRIYFGAGCYGVETASQAYFGKNAVRLTLHEAALLAGIIRSPNRFSPLRNPEGAAAQRDAVLRRMLELKKVTVAQVEQAKRTKVNSHPKRMSMVQENYAMDAVQRDLNVLLTEDQIDNGGLQIYTTIDPAVQSAATQALESHLSRIEKQPGYRHPVKANYAPNGGEDASMPYLEGAVVAIDNPSGGIRALVGGRDYAHSKFNRALAPANRQVGSAFKPFVYALAFSNGLLPGAAVSDGPIQPGEIEGAGNWTPGNSDNTYGGVQPVANGLVQSRNTMSVRVGQFAGLDTVQKTAVNLNLGQNIPRGPAIYIGAFESNLKDLTAAYSIFPNAGVRKQAYIIERIDDADGKPIFRAAHISVPTIDPGVAWMTSELMEQVMSRGTGATARSSLGFKHPAAGKTGTTNDYKDAWFLGYTTAITCGVWVGFDQPTTIMSQGYGAALALPVWTQTMAKASQRYPAQAFQPPVQLQNAMVCSISNQLATSECQYSGTAYQLDMPVNRVPQEPCTVHGGAPSQFAQGAQDLGRRAGAIPNKLFQSFRRFFGGR